MKRATNTLVVVLMVFLTLVFSACSHEDPLLEDASGHAFYNYFDSYENLLKDPCSLSLCGGGGSGGGGVSSGRVDTGGKVIAILSSMAFDWLYSAIANAIFPFSDGFLKAAATRACLIKEIDIIELAILQSRQSNSQGCTATETAKNIINAIYDDEAIMYNGPRRSGMSSVASNAQANAFLNGVVELAEKCWVVFVAILCDDPGDRAEKRGYRLK